VTGPTACVIGWPVRHSRSPLIHGHWLKTLGITGEYVAVPVEPDRIDAFLAAFPSSGFVGGNVTVPHKEAAFRAVAATDEAATAIGAVNTLWLERGRLVGGNTDAYGFLANLDEAVPGWAANAETAVVLGAGGAARAVVWALLDRGFAKVVLVNRSMDRAVALREVFGSTVRPAGWGELPHWLGRADLLVNTTSLGMAGQPPLEVDLSGLRNSAVVTDLVYVPLETPLLRAARQGGLAAVDGLGMLLHQAVPGFERWFGARPTVTRELRALVVGDLEPSA
jgi:shikimate dehydrogenase